MGVEPCKASQLTGTFKVIPGSPGAGSISYRLRLTNTSGPTCFVSGLVGLRLLSKTGKPLPTKVTPVFRPGLTAVKVDTPAAARRPRRMPASRRTFPARASRRPAPRASRRPTRCA